MEKPETLLMWKAAVEMMDGAKAATRNSYSLGLAAVELAARRIMFNHPELERFITRPGSCVFIDVLGREVLVDETCEAWVGISSGARAAILEFANFIDRFEQMHGSNYEITKFTASGPVVKW